MAGAAEEEVKITNLLIVCTLEIQIDYTPINNGKSCLVGQGLICNREITGNVPLIRIPHRHETRKVK